MTYRRPTLLLLSLIIAVTGWSGTALAQVTTSSSASASSSPPGAILYLRGGQKMVVRSYKVDGAMVHIVDKDGTPQVMRSDFVDLKRSDKATKRHQDQLQQQAEQARLQAEAKRQRRASNANRSTNRKGSLLVLDEEGIRPVDEATRQQRAREAADLNVRGDNGKPSLLVFTADWCNWCKKLKRNTLADRAARRALDNYNMTHIDIDKQQNVAREFGVTSVPTLVQLDRKGRTSKTHTGFMSAAELISWLR